MMDHNALLPDDTDLLREQHAAHRACLHDLRGRHPRSASKAARRGDVLPHGRRRARDEGLSRRAGAGDGGAGVRRFRSQTHWRDLAPRLNAHPDFFIRTSDEGHKRFVREFLQRIYDNGDVYEDVYAGFYCVACEEFKAESDLVDGKCPIHDTVPEWIEEKNYFFRLSAYQDRLLALYDARPDFVLPQFRFNEARSFIAGGLQDFSISRSGQPWGIPLPWDEGQVAYVWADALVNYLSALTYARPGEDLVPVFWPEVRHLIAKDILRFHCVYWPAMLLAAGYEVPRQIFAHG